MWYIWESLSRYEEDIYNLPLWSREMCPEKADSSGPRYRSLPEQPFNVSTTFHSLKLYTTHILFREFLSCDTSEGINIELVIKFINDRYQNDFMNLDYFHLLIWQYYYKTMGLVDYHYLYYMFFLFFVFFF